MWDESLEDEEVGKKKAPKEGHTSTGSTGGFGGFLSKLWVGTTPQDTLPKVNKVHGAMYTLPINESDVKPEDVQNGKSKQEIARSNDVQENKYKYIIANI
jgi:hypothetical protein